MGTEIERRFLVKEDFDPSPIAFQTIEITQSYLPNTGDRSYSNAALAERLSSQAVEQTALLAIHDKSVLTFQQFKALRKHLSITQSEMAEALGITREHVGQMERGANKIDRRMSLATCYIVAQKEAPELRKHLTGTAPSFFFNVLASYYPDLFSSIKKETGSETL